MIIDHITVAVSDYEKSKQFFSSALVALDGARQRRVVSPPLHCACSSAG
jgi:catechol 2,3-dioxygenase-like lactoylglutathione lyase family enzyme